MDNLRSILEIAHYHKCHFNIVFNGGKVTVEVDEPFRQKSVQQTFLAKDLDGPVLERAMVDMMSKVNRVGQYAGIQDEYSIMQHPVKRPDEDPHLIKRGGGV